MPPPSNRCPACGPVESDLSSRYCAGHMQELEASCRTEPLEGRPARWGTGAPSPAPEDGASVTPP